MSKAGMTEKGELGWLGRYTLPCILSHTYLQPYPSILAHVQTLNSTYAGPERDLIYSAYLVIDDLQNTLWNEFDNGSPKLTVQSLKTTYSTARQSLVAARKLNNKAVALAEKVENTANEKLKNVQVTTTTQTPRPNPTPEVECCPPNAEIASVCSLNCEDKWECSDRCRCNPGYYYDIFGGQIDLGDGYFGYACVPASECHPEPVIPTFTASP